jgi:PKD repeat protein
MKTLLQLNKRILMLSVFLLPGIFLMGQNVWFNEIHYDNAGSDADETIEIVLENAGSYTLSDFQIDLYNGNGGSVYNTRTLDTYTQGAVSGNFTFYTFNYTAAGESIQNGAPDGFCLSYQGTVVPGQFLSYEGTLVAADGPAVGQTSVDIGVSESSSTPAGNSLQLGGTGTSYANFSWEPEAPNTFGTVNNNQSLGGTPDPEPTNYPTGFSAATTGISIDLSWTDAVGTQLPSAYLVIGSDQDNITPPVDGVAQVDDPDLSDGSGVLNINYGVEMCTFAQLMGETQYFFEIYPYTNAGTNIDYKTDGTPPAANATTQSIINTNDFESGDFGSWTTYSVASDKDWTVLDFGGALGTTWFAEMNGFQENELSNDWLISPALDLDSYANEIMLFYTKWKFGNTDTELTLKYSTDYTGGDPTLASWTDLSFTKPAQDDTWESSGVVDLSGVSGTSVTIAFQYLSSGSPRRWNVDEIAITGDAISAVINVTNPAGGETWEQGTTHNITWSASNTLPFVMIELTTNASGGSPTWTTLATSIPASQGTYTWNISPTQPTSNDCQIRITDMASDAFGLSGIFSIIEPVYVPVLVINEILYNPPESGTYSLEYIEILNNDNISVDLDGYYFSAGVNFTFPSHSIAPGEYALVTADSVAFLNFFGVTGYEWSGGLSNGGELIQLNHPLGFTVDSVEYDDAAPWPEEADGDGPSMVLCDPTLDNADGANWSASQLFQGLNTNGDSIFGSPGAENCLIAPDPDFEADNTNITTGGSVSFTDLTTGSPTQWVWTFIGGDPGSYTGQNPPPITYNTPGTYNVSLYAENAAGGNTETKVDYITVGSFPTADFEASDDIILVGEMIDFTDLSLGDPTSWSWTFEGGTPETSTDQNPMGIMYAAEGAFDVTLVVENANGVDTLIREEYIHVGFLPEASFVVSDDTIFEGETIDFTDQSTNDPESWEWTFEGGDPATSTDQNPMDIKYDDDGTYDVQLIVTNMFGSDTILMEGMITVLDPTGITEAEIEEVRIYPNPTSGLLTLQFEDSQMRTVVVYSMVGKKVVSSSSADSQTDLNLESLPKGLYFIRVLDEDDRQVNTQKVVIR